MKILKRIYLFLTANFSKWQLIALAAILIYAFLISENNIFARWGYDSDIRDLNKQIKHYREQSEIDTQKLQELEADKDQIEKFARENYLMKKSDEDIFIVD